MHYSAYDSSQNGDDISMRYNEVKRYGSYGMANLKKKQIEEKSNVKVHIFKDLSNGPFTSFKTDQYVVAIEESNND